MKKSWPLMAPGFLAWLVVSLGCTTSPPCSAPENVSTQVTLPIPPSSALQQKIKAQEKRINELSAQLKLLKQIDQDQQKQR